MGKLVSGLEAAADAAERLARAGREFNSATEAGGIAPSTPAAGGQIVFNVYPTKGVDAPGGRIGGSGTPARRGLGLGDEEFEQFLADRGITARYLLENEQFLAEMRRQFEKLKADLMAGGFATLLRGGGG